MRCMAVSLKFISPNYSQVWSSVLNSLHAVRGLKIRKSMCSACGNSKFSPVAGNVNVGNMFVLQYS